MTAWDAGEKEFEGNIADHRAYLDAVYDLAKGAIERSREAAKGVQTAATAVGVIYSGVLGLVFSVTDKPLPPRGLVTPIFLGLSIVLTSVYSAYETRVLSESPYPAANLQGLWQDSQQRVSAFIQYTTKVVERRSFSLRASVIALAIGLLFIAAPFVSFTNHSNAATTTPVSIDTVTPAYPSPPVSATSPNKFDEILYQARVNDAATLRKAKLEAAAAPAKPGWTGEDRTWFEIAAGALVIGVLISLIDRRRRSGQTATHQPSAR